MLLNLLLYSRQELAVTISPNLWHRKENFLTFLLIDKLTSSFYVEYSITLVLPYFKFFMVLLKLDCTDGQSDQCERHSDLHNPPIIQKSANLNMFKKVQIFMGRNMIVKIQKNSSFSFVWTNRQTHTHTHTQTDKNQLTRVAKTSLSAQPKGCRASRQISICLILVHKCTAGVIAHQASCVSAIIFQSPETVSEKSFRLFMVIVGRERH